MRVKEMIDPARPSKQQPGRIHPATITRRFACGSQLGPADLVTHGDTLTATHLREYVAQ
ncbi:hypothetical protein ACH4OY_29690 [Micromonospora rubida]|uniref:Uncharacterized protein n=1 Tax=Micromonospora rubida TaxID=2697657 RepID=A0ABW7SVW9_9ACTN